MKNETQQKDKNQKVTSDVSCQVDANVRRKSEQFVAKYPYMFSEDQEWWIDTLTEFFSPDNNAGYLCMGECQHYCDILSQLHNKVLVKFESKDEDEIRLAREWAENMAPKHLKVYVDFEIVPHHNV